MKLNKKARNLGIIFGIIVGIAVGCSSTEEPKEDLRTFAITDGKSYQDIESPELGRIYVIPEGKWKVTRLEDGVLEGGQVPEVQKVEVTRIGTGNKTITEKDDSYYTFLDVLNYVNVTLAKKMAKDGEGATKLLQCDVTGADSEENALILAKSVIKSSLVKTAMFGCDANWGRIMCALGYAGVNFDPDIVDISFIGKCGEIAVCEKGKSIAFDEKKAYEILDEDEVIINVNMNNGENSASAWGCDLSYDYVKINGEYRS